MVQDFDTVSANGAGLSFGARDSFGAHDSFDKLRTNGTEGLAHANQPQGYITAPTCHGTNSFCP